MSRLAHGLAVALVAVGLLAASPAADAGKKASLDAPKGSKKLIRWLRDGTFRDTFRPEPAAHSSQGPHGGTVRTWYSPVLVDDLDQGREVFSRGAVMVKELFRQGDGSEPPEGYAVMIKTGRGDTVKRKAWRYYETFDITRNKWDYKGKGKRLCSDCHSGGTDYLLSGFRP